MSTPPYPCIICRFEPRYGCPCGRVRMPGQAETEALLEALKNTSPDEDPPTIVRGED